MAGIAAAENLKREVDFARQRQDEEKQRRAEAEAAEKSTMMPEPPAEPQFSPEPGPGKAGPREG